jgi:signal transduction histidine kinase/Na+/proline symporter
VIGSVPYIALQLKGISSGFAVIGQATGNADALSGNLTLYVALALAVFAMLFGTRNMDTSEHHRGLMWAIAFESIVKLAAFMAIGLFVVFEVFGGPGDVAATLRENETFHDLFTPWKLPEGFGIQLVLSMTAILCLPRQFHVAVVEYRDTGELRMARWLFPAYLAIFAGLVVPIALAGLSQFSGQSVNPDSYVLALPIAFDRDGLALLAFLGGFSAATGMVIVATVALAIMVSNDIVMPLMLRSGLGKSRGQADLSRVLLRVRRVSMLGITLLAWLYYQTIEAGVPLASIGMLSFSAASQFAPALLIGIYWQGASRMGALTGLVVGVSAWFLLLMLPTLAGGVGMPEYLPGISFNEGATWSLLLNSVAVVLVSLALPDRDVAQRRAGAEGGRSGLITLGELEQTIGRFLGIRQTRAALATHLGVARLEPAALASPATVQFSERLLAGSIGTASARTVLTTALRHRGLGHKDVLELLDQTSQAVQFNRELLESTLDNMSQGVAVVDPNLCLIGWNRRYLELLQYPEGLVHLGQPIAELIRFNAERGLVGNGDVVAEVRKRVEHLRDGQPYRYERAWLDGKVLEIEGNPMPGGGYVTTFSDITHFKNIERKLQEINETLEQRVLQRTRELSDAIREVENARHSAEAANIGKTRFLAAASHDLLQPMNAARLFLSMLVQQDHPGKEQAQLVKRVDRSMRAAEELLTALLDISKFDSGMYQPQPEAIALDDLFEQLRRRFKPLAVNRGLQLRVRPANYFAYSDRNLLYRILQNFLANALRYTESGGVLLGCRRRGETLVLNVWDTGVGIDESEREAIFQEFHRLDYAQGLEERGLGLGLAICDRIARMLGHRMRVASSPGRGSCFSVEIPTAAADQVGETAAESPPARDQTPLRGLHVLCVDNEPDILDGMQLLLERWECRVLTAGNQAAAHRILREQDVPDLLLVDFHLGEQANGLDLLESLASEFGRRFPAIIITADRSAELEKEIRHRGYALLRKPIKPAALRALMSNLVKASMNERL